MLRFRHFVSQKSDENLKENQIEKSVVNFKKRKEIFMTEEAKKNWSVIINAILTAICTILTTTSCVSHL